MISVTGDQGIEWPGDYLKAKAAVSLGERPDEADPEVLLHHRHVLPIPLGVAQLDGKGSEPELEPPEQKPEQGETWLLER